MATNEIITNRKRNTLANHKKNGQLKALFPANKLSKKSGKKSKKRKSEEVSEALGLRSSFLDEVESVPEEILCHRGLAGFASIYIEDAFFDIEGLSSKEKLSEELLKQIGFTDGLVIDTIIKRSLMMGQHLDPLDFINRFVKDELKYNPVLLEHAPQEDDTDVLDFTPVMKYVSAKDDTDVLDFTPVMKCVFAKDDTDVLDFDDYEKDEQNEDCEVIHFFHGTDRYSADDIIKNGILLDFGRHKHDFSDGCGFYLTNSFEHAERWARSQTRKPVVLELKIPKSCLEKASTKFLDVSNKEGRAEWDEVVRENRSGRPSQKLRKQLEGYDCIAGPISVFHSDRASRVPEPGFYQLCIVKQRFAELIGRNAKYTLYTELKE